MTVDKDGASPAGGQPVCPQCSFVNPAGFRYCGACGSALAASPRPGRPAPERRQLTVLFCDLVGSTRIAGRLDPEDFRDVILAYQTTCTGIIERYGGTVSRYMGDGILALFGYPRAHEDDAERATRAGLDIAEAVGGLDTDGGEPLAVRVGISTGLVVVGDLIGEGASEEEAVHGETPNIAARLQNAAPPGSVLISEATHALVGTRFDCAATGPLAMRGYNEPVQAHRVLGVRTVDRLRRADLTPMVNRTQELAWLENNWRQAKSGRGRSVLICGEAGIGKSRMVSVLHERLQGEPHALLRFQCSPHYTNTALHAVSEQIAAAAGIGREDPDAQKLARLAAWLGPDHDSAEAIALFATLLAIPVEDGGPLSAMSTERRRERTFELLVNMARRLSAERPLLVVFEDLHWADPTTRELLSVLIRRAVGMRALVLMTARPDFVPPWDAAAPVEQTELARLNPQDAVELAGLVAGGEGVVGERLQEVVSRTDGIPLFIEELTKVVVTGEKAIPATLQDSLMARLDRLGQAKQIAQIAGALGREFTRELLGAVSDLIPQVLQRGLVLLEEAGLVFRTAGTQSSTYAFKHALIQEAAYESLLRRRRRELHARIAHVLETQFPGTARDAPELLAHHWTEAGDADRATQAWLTAGRRAAERSQHREAIGHLRRGLALLPDLADATLRGARELELRLALGPALITTEGGGAPEVTASYARTLELCEGQPPSAAHFASRWGWWRASMDLRAGRERADELLALAHSLGEPDLILQAHHCQWATLYMVGALADCCRHIELGLGMYDPARHRRHAAIYGGHDVRVCGLGELAVARWLLGHPQEAERHALAAVAQAQALAHVGSRAHAMDYALVLYKFRRDAPAVARRAAELVAYAEEQKLRDHHAKGRFFLAWAGAMMEDAQQGLARMKEAMAAFKDVGTPEDVSLYHEMIAEVCARVERYDEGLRAVDEAFAQTERCGILFWNAELHRRRGLLLAASGQGGDGVDECFRRSLACAREQGALALELRAALSLARLHCSRGDAGPLHEVLAPVHARFAEGHDTPDLRAARSLLDDYR